MPARLAPKVALAVGCAMTLGCGAGQSSGAPSGQPATASPTLASPAASAVVGPPSAAPSPGADGVIRIPLSGAAPDAIELDGDTAWVLAGEGGTLLEVDLRLGREVRAIEVGFGGTHLAVPLPGIAAVGRFSDADNGAFCLLVDLATGALTPVATRELGALAGGEDGIVWALEKADRLVRIDAGTARVTGTTAVDVGENVHVEVRWAGDAAWVGSDGLPVVRVDGRNLERQQPIVVDEGIPFLDRDGLLWGAGPTQLWAIDPETRSVARRITLEGVIEILALDIAQDDAWIAVRRTGRVGSVLHVDLPSESVVEEVAIDLPAALRIAAERVWVASYSTNELVGLER